MGSAVIRPKLSPTQRALMQRMRDAAEPLARRPGGYWTCPSVAAVGESDAEDAIPDWWASTSSVLALERRGLLVRRGLAPEAWRDQFDLTPLGLGAIARARGVTPASAQIAS